MQGLRANLITCVCGLITWGCEPATSSPPRFVVTDSAGIAMSYSRTPLWGRVSLGDPEIELGVVSGPAHLMFDRIRGVVRLDDGSVAVGNQGSNTIRILSETGELLNEFGGSGDGPGEFTLLSSVRRCQTGYITTFDYDNRLVIFDPAGNHLYSREIVLPGDRFGVYELSCDDQGRMVSTGWGRRRNVGSSGRHLP